MQQRLVGLDMGGQQRIRNGGRFRSNRNKHKKKKPKYEKRGKKKVKNGLKEGEKKNQVERNVMCRNQLGYHVAGALLEDLLTCGWYKWNPEAACG